MSTRAGDACAISARSSEAPRLHDGGRISEYQPVMCPVRALTAAQDVNAVMQKFAAPLQYGVLDRGASRLVLPQVEEDTGFACRRLSDLA